MERLRCKMELVIRKPCTYHNHCDETSVGLLHRSFKDGQPRPEEKMCMVCEGVLQDSKRSFRLTGKWKCPVCGITHNLVNGKVNPPLSYWYDALEIR